VLPENCWFKLVCLVTKSGWIIFELHNNCKLKLENPNEPLTKRTQTKLYSEQITPPANRLWAVLSTSSLLHTFLITRTVRNNCKIAHEAWDMFTHFSSEPLCWYFLSAIVLYLCSRSKRPSVQANGTESRMHCYTCWSMLKGSQLPSNQLHSRPIPHMYFSISFGSSYSYRM
jgi:hypothetical protein